MKKIVISIDDGTVFDIKLINILNKYNLKGSFNLNSGLDNFVWYYDDIEIKRLELCKNVQLYDNHEICSHSYTHPRLDLLDYDTLVKEIALDKCRLENIFNRKINGFAIPFDRFHKDTINVCKSLGFKFMRISDVSNNYFINDCYKICANAFTFNNNYIDLFKEFLNNGNKDDVFIFAGHSYDFHVLNSWDLFIELCELIVSNNVLSVGFGDLIK